MASNIKNKSKKRGRPAKQQVATSQFRAFFNVASKFIQLKAKSLMISIRGLVLRNRYIGRGVGAFAISTPPYFVTQYYQIGKFSDDIKTDWPLVGALLDHHVVVGVALAGVWTFLMLALYKMVAAFAQEQPNGWADVPSILLRTLDNIVGAKEQRFSNHLESLRSANTPSTSAGVFGFITQPGQQLNELMHGVYSTVDTLLRAQENGKYVLKVNLAAIDQKQCVNGIHFHFPSNHPVRSSLAALNSPNSAIKNAIRTKKIVVLESIRIESIRSKPSFFVTDASRADEDGSLICYPVTYDPVGAVVFVISIHVDQPGAFKPKFSTSYVELLKPFTLRIKLEYALLALKELTVNE